MRRRDHADDVREAGIVGHALRELVRQLREHRRVDEAAGAIGVDGGVEDPGLDQVLEEVRPERELGIEPAGGELPVWSVREPGRRILLIAHAGTNAVAVCHLLGLQPVPWEWERFVLGHASITRLEALELGDGYTFSLTRLSDVEHLPPADRTR